MRLRLTGHPGVNAYRIRIRGEGLETELAGTFLRVEWAVTFFPWVAATDPREHLSEWRQLAAGSDAVSVRAAMRAAARAGVGGGAESTK